MDSLIPTKKIEQTKDNDTLFSSTFYQAAVGMVHVRMSDGQFVRANHKICEMLDYTEDEFCSKTIPEVTHPEDVLTDFENTQKMINGEIRMFSIEKRLLKKDGTPIWIRLNAVSVARDENGQATYGMAVCEDISQIKQTEHALHESEERFKIMADSAPVAIFVTDSNLETIYVNTGWLDYTGLNFEDSIGLKWQSAIHPNDLQAFMELINWKHTNQEPFRSEVRVRRANGEFGWMLCTGVPRYMPDHKFLGYIGTGVDITDMKQVEGALEQAKRQAEEANRKKSEFLSLMSHELRTPLNAIIGFSEMMETGLTGNLNMRQQQYIEYISASGHHLLNLINDLLDIGKIEAGKMKLHYKQVELCPLISSVHSMINKLADGKEVTLTVDVDPKLEKVHLDPDRFKQILINLINNAIKFNHPGGVVFIRLYKSDDDQWLIGEIQDTGIGIPKTNLTQLFQKFYQIDSTAARSHEGTGLGLALTKDLVELHGGTIHVSSEEGVGSVFTFRLPVLIENSVIEEGFSESESHHSHC